MNKSISTLVPDIYKVIGEGKKLDPKRSQEFGQRLATLLTDRLAAPETGGQLRMSNFGSKCDRQLWYRVNQFEAAEPLKPNTKFGFNYGEIIEQYVLFLAEEAEHKVEYRQGEVELYGVKGHIDAIIDGCLVDVKSANSRSFDKFKFHRLNSDDPFGYLTQLNMYLAAVQDRVEVKGEAAFLAIDKELGHIVLDRYRKQERDWKAEVDRRKALLNAVEPPRRPYSPEPYGKSGNYQLPLPCRYCPFKNTCWPELRTFIYSSGPVFLTKVVKEPDVQENKKQSP